MARRRRRNYARRARTVYRTVRTSRARGGGGSMKPMIDGALAGAGAMLAKKYLPIPYADDIAYLAVGMFRRNNTLKTLGAAGLAADLVSGFTGGNGKSSGGTTY